MAGYSQPGQAQAQQQQQQQQETAVQQAVHVVGQEPLTASMLAAAQPQEQKQMLGKYRACRCDSSVWVVLGLLSARLRARVTAVTS